MTQEFFDVVNERDEVIGRATRSDVHARGLLHRAVHIMVYNSRGEVFLQKRSMKKDRQPGLWDSSSSGHVDSGEDYDACTVRELREDGGSVIFVSHRMAELFAISDRLTVLKDGAVTATREREQTDHDDVVRLMIGRELSDLFPPKASDKATAHEPLLQARELTVTGGCTAVDSVRWSRARRIIRTAARRGSGTGEGGGRIDGTQAHDIGGGRPAGRAADRPDGPRTGAAVAAAGTGRASDPGQRPAGRAAEPDRPRRRLPV